MTPIPGRMRNEADDPEFRFAARIEHRVDALVRQSSVQIFKPNLAGLRQHGSILVVEGPPISGIATGTLFEFNGTTYLVTAAHVLHDFVTPTRELRVGLGNPTRPRPIPCAVDDCIFDDTNDVAVMRLPDHFIPHFICQRAIRITDIDFDGDLDEVQCVVFGYLWEGSRTGKDGTIFLVHNFKLWTNEHAGRISSRRYDSANHLLLEYKPSAISVLDGIETASPSSLGGLSGSSVWKIFSPENVELGWTEENAKVVGVENVVYGERVIGCTRWHCIVPLIEHFAPGFEAAVASVRSKST